MAALKYPLSLVIRAVDRVTGPLQKINAQLERTTSRLSAPFRRLSGRLSALSNATGLPKVVDGIRGVGTAASNVGSKILGLGKLLGGLVTGATLGGLGLAALITGAQEAGGRLKNLSTITGLSVNAYAELEFAAKRSGVANEEFAGSMKVFNKSLSEARRGVGPLASLLTKVGPVYLKQLKAASSNEQAFNLLAKAMGRIQDPGKRAELAAAAFGKAGAGMVNALKDGPAGVDALRSEFRSLVGDQEAFAENANALGDAFDNLELSMFGLRNTAAGALFPAITKLSEAVTKFIVKNRDGLQRWAAATGEAISKWIDGGGLERLGKSLESLAVTVGELVDKLGGLEGVAKLAAVALGAPLVLSLVQLAGALGKATLALVGFLGRLGAAQALGWMAGWVKYLWMMRASLIAGLVPSLSAAAASVWAFTTALLANPITWIVVAVAGFAALAFVVYKNWDLVSTGLQDIWQRLTSAAQTTWTGLKLFFVNLWDGITAVFMSAWEKIKPMVDGVMSVAQFTPVGFAIKGALTAGEALLGADRAAPPRTPAAGASGEARVTVDFANVPRGTRITPARENTAALDMNLGFATVGP